MRMSLGSQRFEFAEYLLDAGEKVVLRNGKSVPIPPKIFQLLLLLVENHGHIVEKKNLMDVVWADSFVEESNLTFSVRKLRQILGDDAQHPKFIETVPRRGYRFIAPVRTINDASLVSDLPPRNVAGRGPSRSRVVEKRTLIFFSLGLLVLAAISLSWRFLFERQVTPVSVRTERVTYNGSAKLASISPDGKFIAYLADEENGQSIWLRNVATGTDVEILADSEGDIVSLAFSRDGNRIYYIEKDTLFRLPMLGGLPTAVIGNFAVGSQFKSVTFSPDGRQLAFIRREPTGKNALVIANEDGSGERVLASSGSDDLFRRSPAWSPDGRVIALVSAKGLKAVQVSDGRVSAIPSPAWKVVSQLTWRPDGAGLFAVATEGDNFSSQVWWLAYPTGDARNITGDFNNYQSISAAGDGGTIAAVRIEQSAHIWSAAFDGGNLRQLTNGIEGYDGIYGLAILSNGDVYYETTPGEKGRVWVVSAGGQTPRLVLDNSAASGASPDGKYIVFQGTDESNSPGLFRYEIARGEIIRLTNGKDVWVAFSPDARWVVFTRWSTDTAIWKVPIDGGEAIKLTDVPGYALAPAVSPDGSSIAFHWIKREPNRLPEIAVIPSGGGSIIKTFELSQRAAQGYGKHALQWSPDGRAIDHVVFRDNASNIWRQPVDGSPPFQITAFSDQQIFNFAYSPDGRNIALSRGTYARDVVLLKTINE